MSNYVSYDTKIILKYYVAFLLENFKIFQYKHDIIMGVFS